MVFKYQIECVNFKSEYQETASNFTFEILPQLYIQKATLPYYNLKQNRRRIFPLIASIYRKMYGKGWTKRCVILMIT